jgi:hypothetical protein
MIIRKTIFIGLVICYGILFLMQERLSQQVKPVLAFPLPAVVQKTVLGYLRQLAGEIHFIKTAVFLGGHFTNNPDEAYANSLASNFHAMVDLHPLFIDSYFLCQSSLPHIGPDLARETNAIHQIGAEANPDNWILPFFMSFNYNYYINEPRKAAEVLRSASMIEGAPAWFEHLASIRAAQGGDILSGLIWLKVMVKAEENESLRERYGREIDDFEMALNIQKAIIAYQKLHGRYPAALEDLVPEFVHALPNFNENFVLEWEPPKLQLKRPESMKLAH